MKNYLILIAIILFAISCDVSDDDYPKIENITRGTKWNLEIGSTHEQVYTQLQELSTIKSFDAINIVNRQPFVKPRDIQSDLSLYRSISLETNSGVTKRILIQFNGEKVISIEKGSAHLDTITKWPEDTPNESAILINDQISEINQKLTNIYQIPAYQNLQIVLSDKWIEKPYDSDMTNYDEWSFAFLEDINSEKAGFSSVRLYFDNDKLIKIRHEYKESEIFN